MSWSSATPISVRDVRTESPGLCPREGLSSGHRLGDFLRRWHAPFSTRAAGLYLYGEPGQPAGGSRGTDWRARQPPVSAASSGRLTQSLKNQRAGQLLQAGRPFLLPDAEGLLAVTAAARSRAVPGRGRSRR